jgi:hypothetical protein
MRGRVKQYGALTTVFAVCGLVPAAVGQTETPYRIHVESNQLQTPIRAESNLVLVPVFVFDKDAMGRGTPAEWGCIRADAASFYSLALSQPYAERECNYADVRGLSAKDFRVFQDGVEQKIQRVAVENWVLPARDNMTWHAEISLMPAGVWSTTDLASLVLPYWERNFYTLAYVPSNSQPGCHRISVTVDRPNTRVFARDQYCAGQTPSDPLYGTTYDTQLQNDLASVKKGKLRLELQGAYFYAEPGKTRLRVVIEFPWGDLYHVWDLPSATLYARIGVLGTAYGRNGGLAARFSDLLYPSYWPTFVQGGQIAPSLLAADSGDGTPDNPGMAYLREADLKKKDPGWLPARYETQIDLPPGDYDLRVVVSDTQKFGTAEMPLHIDGYDGRALGLSSVMLCKRFRDAHVAAVERAAANFAPQYVPLASKNIEVTPTGDTRFNKGEPLIPYFEVYEPLLTTQPATEGQLAQAAGPVIPVQGGIQGGRSSVQPSATLTVQAHIRIVDGTTCQVVKDFPPVDGAPYERAGSSMIPIAREIPFDQLPKGAYRLEVQATDSAGRSTPWRTASFTVE